MTLAILFAFTLFAAVRNGPIMLMAPLLAVCPLVMVALTEMTLRHIQITPRIVIGAVLTVGGVALVLAS